MDEKVQNRSVGVKVDKLASHKISLISFFAICAVVSWHVSDSGGVLKRWLAPVFSVWAVPWFFFVSGVFFVYSIQKVALGRFLESKVKSLLIPYIVWCVLGVAILLLMGTNLDVNLCSVFALDRLHPVGDSPMWYIRALMIIFSMAVPIWCLSIKILKAGWLQRMAFSVALVLTVTIFQKLLSINLHLGPGSSIYFFLVGVVFCDRVVQFPMLSVLDARMRILLGLMVLFTALLVRGVWFAMGYDYYKMGGTLVANLSVALFMFALLVLMDSSLVVEHGWRIFGRFTKYTSFVYMSHWIFLGSMISVARTMGTHPDVVYVAFSICMPFLFVAIGAIVRRFVPNVYLVLTGNRG